VRYVVPNASSLRSHARDCWDHLTRAATLIAAVRREVSKSSKSITSLPSLSTLRPRASRELLLVHRIETSRAGPRLVVSGFAS
jgi:hypothetical protein